MPNLPTKLLIRGNPPLKPPSVCPNHPVWPHLPSRRLNDRLVSEQQISHHPPKHHAPPGIQMRHIRRVKIIQLRIHTPQRIDIAQARAVEIEHPRAHRLASSDRGEALVVQAVCRLVRGSKHPPRQGRDEDGLPACRADLSREDF